MRVHKIALILATCLAVSSRSSAQSEKFGVFFASQPNDAVGRQLVFLLKDKIHNSGTFQEVYNEKDGLFIVSMVTLDPTTDNSAQSTVYAFDILMENNKGFNYFLNQYVGVCGLEKVDSCADTLYNDLGEELEKLKQFIKNHPNA